MVDCWEHCWQLCDAQRVSKKCQRVDISQSQETFNSHFCFHLLLIIHKVGKPSTHLQNSLLVYKFLPHFARTVLEWSELLVTTVRYERVPGLEVAGQRGTRSTDVGLQVNGCRGKTERSRARTVKWRARVEIKLSSQSDSGILESPNILRSIKVEAWKYFRVVI